MSNNPSEIIIGGQQSVFVAPEGTPLPVSIDDPLNAAFINLGYTDATGVKFTDNKTVANVQPSQEFYPVREFVTARAGTVDFVLLQWNQPTVELAFGGGTWSIPSAGLYRYHPPAPQALFNHAMVVDASDGTRNFRITVSRGFVTSNTSAVFARTGPALLPITFTILAPEVGDPDPWTFDTDDPQFALTSGS